MKMLIKPQFLDGIVATGATVATTTVTNAQDQTQKQILDLIVHQDDVSWKQIIFELIDTEQMDPWDIDISLISQKFRDMLLKLKQMDFRISGKVVVACAVLLKMKAEKLHAEELAALDHLIQSAEEPVDLGFGDLDMFDPNVPFTDERPKLVPRTPQPRKRKVSVYDLVEALEKALETQQKRPPKRKARILDKIDPPDRASFKDITQIIREVYDHIHNHYEGEGNKPGSLEFSHLCRSEDKRDKVLAFIPLLHLENALKVEMEQPEHFGNISIHLRDTTPPDFTKFKEEAS